jgi:hypothetical protein
MKVLLSWDHDPDAIGHPVVPGTPNPVSIGLLKVTLKDGSRTLTLTAMLGGLVETTTGLV